MSITRDQLSVQLDRLIDTFGDKAFSDQRIALIWEIVNGLEYSQVISIVDGFLKKSRHAPLPDDFSQAAKDFRRSSRDYALGEIRPREIAQCLDCGDSGFIRLSRNTEFESWAKWQTGSAPCHCARGDQLIEAARRMKSPMELGPKFNENWLKSYSVIPAYGQERVNNFGDSEFV